MFCGPTPHSPSQLNNLLAINVSMSSVLMAACGDYKHMRLTQVIREDLKVLAGRLY